MNKERILMTAALAIVAFGVSYVAAGWARNDEASSPPVKTPSTEGIGVLGVSASGGRTHGSNRVVRLRRTAPLPDPPREMSGSGGEGVPSPAGPSATASPSGGPSPGTGSAPPAQGPPGGSASAGGSETPSGPVAPVGKGQ